MKNQVKKMGKASNFEKEIKEVSENEVPKDVLESKKRIEMLTKNIFDTVKNTTDECEGDFTIYELNDVFLKVMHSFNQRFLEDQFKEKK